MIDALWALVVLAFILGYPVLWMLAYDSFSRWYAKRAARRGNAADTR